MSGLAMSVAGSDPFGSSMTTELRTTAGSASQTSEALMTKTTLTIRPSGGQIRSGCACTVIEGGRVSRTSTISVSGAEVRAPSDTTSVMVETPRGRTTLGVAPDAVPKGPVQRYVRGSPSG